jgi:hypothetical protein
MAAAGRGGSLACCRCIARDTERSSTDGVPPASLAFSASECGNVARSAEVPRRPPAGLAVQRRTDASASCGVLMPACSNGEPANGLAQYSARRSGKMPACVAPG